MKMLKKAHFLTPLYFESNFETCVEKAKLSPVNICLRDALIGHRLSRSLPVSLRRVPMEVRLHGSGLPAMRVDTRHTQDTKAGSARNPGEGNPADACAAKANTHCLLRIAAHEVKVTSAQSK